MSAPRPTVEDAPEESTPYTGLQDKDTAPCESEDASNGLRQPGRESGLEPKPKSDEITSPDVDALIRSFSPEERARLLAALQVPSDATDAILRLTTVNTAQLATQVKDFFEKVVGFLSDPDFARRAMETIMSFGIKFGGATWEYVKAHPYQVAFFILAIILIANPVALAGFGAYGPVAGKKSPCSQSNANFFIGSLAAALQATMGGYADMAGLKQFFSKGISVAVYEVHQAVSSVPVTTRVTCE